MEYNVAMSVEKAAILLRRRLGEAPWLTAVGVGLSHGRPCIYVYVNSVREANADILTRREWRGFPVVIRKTGPFRAISIAT